MNDQANYFLLGAIVIACVTIGLFFLRFWHKTHDRLFALFAIAFVLLSLNWAALALTSRNEVRTVLYFIRLVAFLLILYAIIDKNRPRIGKPRA